LLIIQFTLIQLNPSLSRRCVNSQAANNNNNNNNNSNNNLSAYPTKLGSWPRLLQPKKKKTELLAKQLTFSFRHEKWQVINCNKQVEEIEREFLGKVP
jgi:hypothetical protein